MAQRRSRNRRLSVARRSGNFSGYLDDNTNIDDGNDPLWFNRTSVRPSTSLVMTRNASSVLSNDTSVEASQVSERWYNNLSKSEASRLAEATVQNNVVNESNKEQEAPSLFTESESDQEPQKRRTKFGFNKRKIIDKTDKSNIFLKALEKTTDSHTRNLTRTNTLLLDGHESESTNDDSKTVQRLRPRLFRDTKRVVDESNKFDNIFDGTSATEILANIQTPRVSLNRINEEQLTNSQLAENIAPSRKSILKKQSKNGVSSSPETVQKQQRRSEKAVVDDVSQNEAEISSGNIQEQIIPSTPVTRTSRKLSQKKSGFFSQERKSGSTRNVFDDVFDSNANEENSSATEKNLETSKRSKQNDNNNGNDNVSESSSIPGHIRRTRSFSAFARKQSEEEINVESLDNDEAQPEVHKSQRLSQRNKSSASQKSKNSSMAAIENVRESDESSSSSFEMYIQPSKSQEIVEESNDDEEVYGRSSQAKKSKSNESKRKSQNQSSKRKSSRIASKSQETIEESDEEKSISSVTKSKSNESKNKSQQNQSPKRKSSQAMSKSRDLVEESDDEDIYDKSVSPVKKSKVNLSNESKSKSQKRSPKLKSSQAESAQSVSNATNDDDNNNASNSIVNKTRSKLLQRNSQAESNNVFDQISYETSKEPSASNAAQEDSGRSEDNDKSNEPGSTRGEEFEEEEENDAETSSMPKNIRRTMSLMVQKSKVADESSDAHETSTRSKDHRDESLGDAASNKSSRKGKDSVLREANHHDSSKLFRAPKAPTLNVSTKSSSNESLKENRMANVSRSSNTSLSKKSRADRTLKHKASTDGAESDFNMDDLLSTPHPASSTLNPHGKRITQFFLRQSIVPESPILAAPVATTSSPTKEALVEDKRGEEEEEAAAAVAVVDNVAHDGNDDEEDVDVDGDSSDASNCPLMSRQAGDIPRESENEDASVSLKAKEKSTNAGLNASSIDEATWSAIRKKTDALKMSLEARAKRAELEERERAQQQARVEAKLKRRINQQEAEKRRKNRKPIDKAFQINGQPYKQPRLPRPKKWVTMRLYNYLRKYLEPEYGLETRIRSEEFVQKLTDVYNVVVKRKKYDNYKAEVNDLMKTMAKLKIIENRHDFWRFCSDFMPPDFKDKVVPMQLPGNVRNIPFNPDLVYAPLLKSGKDRREKKVSSESDNDDQ